MRHDVHHPTLIASSALPERMPPKPFQFTLFHAGTEPNSVLARRNLEELSGTWPADSYQLRYVDVMEQAEEAYRQGVVVTPTLVALRGEERILIVGNLSDRERVRAALGMPDKED